MFSEHKQLIMGNLKTVLKLHKGSSDQPHGIFRDSFEVTHCDYELFKDVDRNGKAASVLTAGNIKISITSLPPAQLMKWMFDIHSIENGEISTHNSYSEVIEKVAFEEGRLVGIHFNYDMQGTKNVTTVLMINAQRIFLGDNEYKNYWQ